MSALSLRALYAKVDAFSVPKYEPSERAARTALVFVFNEEYLHPFKVLLYSLLKTGSFIDSPIYIYSNENAVLKNRLVKLVADRTILVTEEDIIKFKDISRENIAGHYQLDWIPKYTFLKWSIFEESDCDRALFIDADVIALRNVEAILEYADKADLVVCPSMRRPAKAQANESFEASYSYLQGMLRGSSDVFDHQPSVNSGIMLIGKKLLTKSFQKELLDSSVNHSLVNEQGYISRFFAENPKYKVLFIGSRFNLASGQIENLGGIAAADLLNEVVLLHFPGRRKPWRHPVTSSSRLTHMLWHKCSDDAARLSRFLAKDKQEEMKEAKEVRQMNVASKAVRLFRSFIRTNKKRKSSPSL